MMNKLKPTTGDRDVEAFLDSLKDVPVRSQGQPAGRLVLAMDATMSRQHSWDTALAIQANMFAEAGRVGGLAVQLVYFRGFRECRASKWTPDTASLARLMAGIRCAGGHTQVLRVLKHLRSEAASGKVNACIYIGDALEESIDSLASVAGEIGLLGVPVFAFQEGEDEIAETGFREIARLTRGAYFRFGADSADILKDLLSAVAVYAAGGLAALEAHSSSRGGTATRLLKQLE
ncbi:VWA domain-containing protein [Aestuariivirga sp.]|jgi:hypothetical protein|uniref:VWA domain-containing protein n=1 Tax=Aestuariivirga sp. TaxID=2650926 RepID=UPI00378353C1